MAEQNTMVINGRLHVQGADGLYRMQPISMDEARGKTQRPEYVVQDGSPYQVIRDGEGYARHLQEHGTAPVMAEKSGAVLVRRAREGEQIPVYSQNGVLEAQETGAAGKWVLTKADQEGRAVVDEFGHSNSWQVDEATLRKKYAVGQDIEDGSFAKPAGGIQTFMQVDRNVAFMVPWGPNGSLVPQVIEKGGYMNVTNPGDIYGISGRDFADTYQAVGVSRDEMSVSGSRPHPERGTEFGDLGYSEGDEVVIPDRTAQRLSANQRDDVGPMMTGDKIGDSFGLG